MLSLLKLHAELFAVHFVKRLHFMRWNSWILYQLFNKRMWLMHFDLMHKMHIFR